MSEMVERVARAIWQESVGPAQWPEWDTWAPDAWSKVRSRAQARAALVALFEPTGGMKDAGAETYGLGNSVIGPAGAALVGQPTKAYQAMIDKALED
jgi:hypothetical protein